MKNKTTAKAVFALCAIVFTFVAPCASADDASAVQLVGSPASSKLKPPRAYLEPDPHEIGAMVVTYYNPYGNGPFAPSWPTLSLGGYQFNSLTPANGRIKKWMAGWDAKAKAIMENDQLDQTEKNAQMAVLCNECLQDAREKKLGRTDILSSLEENTKRWNELAGFKEENANDDEEEEEDEADDDDEPETEPHRKWLEEFVDGKLEDVPDELWSKTLYEAYFEAYDILKADSTCPPDLLVEVADLCEQLKPAYEATLEALENAKTDENPPEGQEGPDSTDDGSDNEDEDKVDGEHEGEEGAEDGEKSEEEPEEEEWNGPYVDDEIPDFGGGSSSGSSGDPEKKTAAGGEEPAARPLVNPASGGSSGGRVPSSTGQLYGRAPTSESSGAGFVSAGNYFGAGTTADASVATNYVDEIPYELLQWKFGGFHPPTNAVRSSVTVADLRASRGGMEMKWIRDLGAWGIPYEVPDALACLFVKNEEGEWVGGKFEWISSSRKTRGFENIRSGYGGWNLRGVPNPCEVAFLVFRKDGRRRSNIVVGLWER